MGDRKEPTPLPPAGTPRPDPPPAPPARADVQVGDDGLARYERDGLGLDMDPKTGRAYPSQGDARNLVTGHGGRFHQGIMVPRAFRCSCQRVVHEAIYGQGFENCGLLDLGPGGKYNLCPECVRRALHGLPQLRGIVKAFNRGDVRG